MKDHRHTEAGTPTTASAPDRFHVEVGALDEMAYVLSGAASAGERQVAYAEREFPAPDAFPFEGCAEVYARVVGMGLSSLRSMQDRWADGFARMEQTADAYRSMERRNVESAVAVRRQVADVGAPPVDGICGVN